MKTVLSLALTWLVLGSLACKSDAPISPVERPDRWAKPLARVGLPNLYKVSNGLYRGAQPTAAGFKSLQDMGVRTVVNLRTTHSDRQLVGELELELIEIPVQAWNAESEELARFLLVATDQTKTPVFVHCLHGADRTGMMSAIYRVMAGGWSKEEAIDEMKNGGYGHHSIFINLVGEVEKLDVAALTARIRSTAEVAPASAPTSTSASDPAPGPASSPAEQPAAP